MKPISSVNLNKSFHGNLAVSMIYKGLRKHLRILSKIWKVFHEFLYVSFKEGFSIRILKVCGVTGRYLESYLFAQVVKNTCDEATFNSSLIKKKVQY